MGSIRSLGNQKLKTKAMKYLTENGVDITKRIEERMTLLFEGTDLEHKELAEYKAKELRSYVYEVYADDKNGRRLHVGYAVPR